MCLQSMSHLQVEVNALLERLSGELGLPCGSTPLEHHERSPCLLDDSDTSNTQPVASCLPHTDGASSVMHQSGAAQTAAGVPVGDLALGVPTSDPALGQPIAEGRSQPPRGTKRERPPELYADWCRSSAGAGAANRHAEEAQHAAMSVGAERGAEASAGGREPPATPCDQPCQSAHGAPGNQALQHPAALYCGLPPSHQRLRGVLAAAQQAQRGAAASGGADSMAAAAASAGNEALQDTLTHLDGKACITASAPAACPARPAQGHVSYGSASKEDQDLRCAHAAGKANTVGTLCLWTVCQLVSLHILAAAEHNLKAGHHYLPGWGHACCRQRVCGSSRHDLHAGDSRLVAQTQVALNMWQHLGQSSTPNPRAQALQTGSWRSAKSVHICTRASQAAPPARASSCNR